MNVYIIIIFNQKINIEEDGIRFHLIFSPLLLLTENEFVTNVEQTFNSGLGFFTVSLFTIVAIFLLNSRMKI